MIFYDLKHGLHCENLQSNYHSKLYKIYLYIIALCENRYNFLSLQVVMKMIFIKIAAVMALVWYSLGIIGFDVHTCNASGRSFIATFVKGTSCEDIHPDHGCGHEHHDCTCGHHHSEETVVSYPQHCCTDDYQALAITGSTSDPSRESGDLSSLCFHCKADYTFAPAPKASVSLERVSLWLDSRFRISCSQALLSVWRI